MKKLKVMAVIFTASTTLALANENEDSIISAHKKMLMEKFPSAEFTDFEKDRYKGKDIYEYEFVFKDKDYEAFISAEGQILRLGLDD